MHEETSVWLASYAIFWLAYCIYFAFKIAKKYSMTQQEINKENEETVETMYDMLSKFEDMELMNFMRFLFAFLIVALIAFDAAGYFLTYSYLPLEGFKETLFYISIVLFIVAYIDTIAKFARLIKMALNGAQQEEVLRLMNKKNPRDKILSIIVRASALYFSLQFCLWSLF